MEPVSWDTETKPQRKMCVALEDYLAATPIGCGYVDQRVVNTARNSNAIAAFRAVHDVSGPDSEIYRQESYFSGPRVGVEYASVMDINPVQSLHQGQKSAENSGLTTGWLQVWRFHTQENYGKLT